MEELEKILTFFVQEFNLVKLIETENEENEEEYRGITSEDISYFADLIKKSM